MAEKSTIARPYSQALFELAQEQGKLKEWSDMLQLVAAITSDPQMQALISNTSIRKDQLAELVINVAGKYVDANGQNLIKVLAENRRLEFVPEIAKQYEVLRAEAENTLDAELISAFKVSADQQKKITGALEKRLGRKISLTTRIDSTLIGGAIIRAGDLVIDGSAVGQLQRLTNALSH